MTCAILLAVALTSSAAADEPMLPAELFKVWMHSREEDKAGESVYRPAGFKFPPARGRTGFEIRKNGEFIYIGIAPTDGPMKVPGKWKAEGKDKIVATFPGTKQPAMTLQVLSVDDKVLKLKK